MPPSTFRMWEHNKVKMLKSKQTIIFMDIFQISPVAVKSGIRINVMCPAFVDTRMFKNISSGDPSQTYHGDPALVKAFIDRVGVVT